MLRLSSIFVVSFSVAAVYCLPGGPPINANILNLDSVCLDLVPSSNSPHVFQSGQNNYDVYTSLPVISFNRTDYWYKYTSGEKYNVTIAGNDFRGFLMQARDPSGTTVGTFVTLSATQQILDCSDAGVNATATITHNNLGLVDFTNQTFYWTAPSGGGGYIQLRYTLVPVRNQYFGPLTAPLAPTEPTAPTRAVGQYPLTRRYPEGCEPASCDIFIGVAINAASSGYLDFYMEASAQAWVASGFSKTRTMFDADVIVCIYNSLTSMVTGLDTWNPSSPTRNNVLDAVQNIVFFSGSFENGRIKCTLAKTIIGTNVPAQDLNLNENGTSMLYARGNTLRTPQQITGHAPGLSNRAATAPAINPEVEAGAIGLSSSILLSVIIMSITLFLQL